MMDASFVSPVFDFAVRSQRLNGHLFRWFSEGQHQKDVQVFRQSEGGLEPFAVDESNDAAAEAFFDCSQEDALGYDSSVILK